MLQLALLRGQECDLQMEHEHDAHTDDCKVKNSVVKNDNMSVEDSETSLHKCGINADILDPNKQNTCLTNSLQSSSSMSSSSFPQKTAALAPPPAPPPPPPTPPSLQQLSNPQPGRTVLTGSFWMMKEM